MTNSRSLHIRDAKLGNLVPPTHPYSEDYDTNLTEDQVRYVGDTCTKDNDDSVTEINDSALLAANISVFANDDTSSEETLHGPSQLNAGPMPHVYTRRSICPFQPITADESLPPPGF